jgi:hypothetical protein
MSAAKLVIELAITQNIKAKQRFITAGLSTKR